MDAPMPARATRTLLLGGLVAMAGLPWQACLADDRAGLQAGTYSSLVFNDESGDLGGYELQVLPAGEGYKLVLQVAEGELVDVVVADATLTEGTLQASFDLPRRPGCHLDAEVMDASLVVHFDFGDGVSDTATLPRSVGYWDRSVAPR